MNGLEDIADKEYAKDVLKMIGTLQQKMLSVQSQFNLSAHPTNPVECCADANPKTMLPNET